MKPKRWMTSVITAARDPLPSLPWARQSRWQSRPDQGARADMAQGGLTGDMARAMAGVVTEAVAATGIAANRSALRQA